MYHRFYSLNELPFRLTPDPRYLFLSDKHREALAHLIFSIRQGSGFAVITGEIGTGKTTLIRTLLHDSEPDTISAYIFNPTVSDLELLQAVNQEFGLPTPASKRELMDTLNEFLLQQKQEGKTAVVIVDEAQALNPAALEQLRLLSNLETETEKLLQIILVGQPELRKLLARPELSQLKQRISLSWHLSALARPETTAYVRHRLSVAAGGFNRSVFTRKALRLIHTYSRGVPRMINIVCDRALLVGYTSEKERIGGATVRRAIHELQAEGQSETYRWFKSALVAATAAGMVITSLLSFSAPDQAPRQSGGEVTREGAVTKTSTGAEAELREITSTRHYAFSALDPLGSIQAISSPGVPVTAEAIRQPPAGTHAEPTAVRLFAQLAAMSTRESELSALTELLKLWEAPALSIREREQEPLDFASVARTRGLNEIRVSGTWERLRLLNLPAILELILPSSHHLRMVALSHLTRERAELTVNGKSFMLPLEQLKESWQGDAHLLWRDYEHLPNLLAQGSVGPSVNRLNELLEEVGAARNLSTYYYDEVTSRVVASFQHRKGIRPDGIVGPLTKILLYGSAPRYDSPRLYEKSSS